MIDASLKWGIYNQLLDASAWSLSLPFPYVSIYLSQHETQTSLVFLQLKLRKKLFWLFKQLVVCELKLANSELTPILEKRIMYPNQLVNQTTSLLHYRIISTRTRTLLAIIHKLNRFHILTSFTLQLLFRCNRLHNSMSRVLPWDASGPRLSYLLLYLPRLCKTLIQSGEIMILIYLQTIS